MKKALPVLLALLLAGWVVYQHAQTGRWSVLPVKLTPEETELAKLAAELDEIETKIATQERVAGRAGVEAPVSLTELEARRDAIKAKIELVKARVPK